MARVILQPRPETVEVEETFPRWDGDTRTMYPYRKTSAHFDYLEQIIQRQAETILQLKKSLRDMRGREYLRANRGEREFAN